MLDVHPAHHAASTRRDFVIHIATIVLGLLIAVGLEQTVEYIHHRTEVREAREALARERDDNSKEFAIDTDYLAHNIAALRNNLTVLEYLRAHSGTSRAKLPGVLVWPNLYVNMVDITWRSTQSANITQLMPRDEVSGYAELYEALTYMNQTADSSWTATTRAYSYTFSDPNPTHLTPAQIEREIELTQEALLGKYRLGIVMGNIGKSFPEFSHAPSLASLQNLSVAAPLTPEQQSELAEATRITKARIPAIPTQKP